MVDLRTDSERIVRDLKRGERMILSYRGEPLAELVPSGFACNRTSPLEALKHAHELTTRDVRYSANAAAYLRELNEDQKAWGERHSS